MTRRSDRRRLFRKSWGFKFVCYSLVLLISTLFLLEPVARVIAKETIFSQVINQAVTTTRNSILSKEIFESSQSITDSLQKLMSGNHLPKHQLSQLLNQLTSESLSQSQIQPPSPSKPKKATEAEPQVLIAEVVVSSSKGNLEDKLLNEVYRSIRTKPGHHTTRTQLQEDINSIFKTGYFSNVQATPEDTPLGVRVKFEVIPNPILVQIQLKGSILKTLQVKGKEISLQEAINNIFSKQYGQTLNLNTLQAGIKELIQLYQNNGYTLAQIVGSPEVEENGVVTLNVAEGIIERIQVRFFKKGRTVPKRENCTLRNYFNSSNSYQLTVSA